MSQALDRDELRRFVDGVWNDSIVPELVEYIKIPNKSPAYDAEWQAHGHMDRAVAQIEAWCKAREIPGLTVEVVRLAGRTPVIWMEVPGTGKDTCCAWPRLPRRSRALRPARRPG